MVPGAAISERVKASKKPRDCYVLLWFERFMHPAAPTPDDSHTFPKTKGGRKQKQPRRAVFEMFLAEQESVDCGFQAATQCCVKLLTYNEISTLFAAF